MEFFFLAMSKTVLYNEAYIRPKLIKIMVIAAECHVERTRDNKFQFSFLQTTNQTRYSYLLSLKANPLIKLFYHVIFLKKLDLRVPKNNNRNRIQHFLVFL